MTKRDYYDVLGIQKNADEKEVKRAYRILAKKYHPDTNPGNKTAEQKFKEITEAYNILSDPEKKKLYDQYGFAAFDGSMGAGNESGFSGSYSGRNGGRSTAFHFEGDDIFGNMFDDFFCGRFSQETSGKKNTKRQKGQDLKSEITITFEEAAFGCKKRLYMEGTGQAMEVTIPAGIDEGKSVRLKGKGHQGSAGNPAGDLVLKVHIAQKPGYERKGMDVYTTENIPYTTAVLGGTAVFHTLYGDVKCRIPVGTQSGTKIRLKQKGIVSAKDASVCGDAYVTIQIAVPRNPTPQERKKIQELQELGYRNVG